MTIKPFLSDKIVLTEKLNLIKKDEIFEGDIDTAQILNNYFLILPVILKLENIVTATLFQITSKVVIKSIVKYRSHPTILKIGVVCNREHESLFLFSHVEKEEILKCKSRYRHSHKDN